MLEYDFSHLNFYRLAIRVVDFNKSDLKFFRSIGFKKEG